MPDDGERHFQSPQEGLHEPSQGASSRDSLSARTLSITLFAAIGILVVLLR
jgi:hypothetical protein